MEFSKSTEGVYRSLEAGPSGGPCRLQPSTECLACWSLEATAAPTLNVCSRQPASSPLSRFGHLFCQSSHISLIDGQLISDSCQPASQPATQANMATCSDNPGSLRTTELCKGTLH